jgi:hypothetical protein
MQALLDRLAPRQLALIMGGLLVLFTSALFTHLIWPRIKTYRAAVSSYGVLEQALSGGGLLEPQLAAEKDEIESLGRRLHGDMAELPLNQIEAYIIGRLQRISWETHMELVSVRPGEGQKVLMFREVAFQVEVTGTYFDFYNWLRAVERELGFVVVKQFEISARDRREASPRLSVSLTMVSYRAMSS